MATKHDPNDPAQYAFLAPMAFNALSSGVRFSAAAYPAFRNMAGYYLGSFLASLRELYGLSFPGANLSDVVEKSIALEKEKGNRALAISLLKQEAERAQKLLEEKTGGKGRGIVS